MTQKTFAYFDTKGRLVKLRLEDLPEANRTALTLPDAPLEQDSPDRQQNVDGGLSRCGGESSTDTSTAACDVPEEFAPGCVVEPTKPILPRDPTEGESQKPDNKVADGPQTLVSAGPFAGPQAPSVFSADVPLPRLHGMICMRGSTLILMGGLMELGSKEITLDDCWSLNLNKRWARLHLGVREYLFEGGHCTASLAPLSVLAHLERNSSYSRELVCVSGAYAAVNCFIFCLQRPVGTCPGGHYA